MTPSLHKAKPSLFPNMGNARGTGPEGRTGTELGIWAQGGAPYRITELWAPRLSRTLAGHEMGSPLYQ